MREKAICGVIRDDDETEKQVEAEQKNKGKQAQVMLPFLL